MTCTYKPAQPPPLKPKGFFRDLQTSSLERESLHNRLVGRVEVEPDDVDHFFSEFWIVGELEWVRQMWLEAMLLPDALHGGVDAADLLGQHTRTPVRCVPGLLLGGTRHNREPHFGTDRLLARARLAPVLEKTLDAAVHAGFLPAPNRRLRHPSLALNGIRAEAATRQQHNACACNDFLRRLAIGDELVQCRGGSLGLNACINVSHALLNLILQALGNPINGSQPVGVHWRIFPCEHAAFSAH
jgi:hypothetical protein